MNQLESYIKRTVKSDDFFSMDVFNEYNTQGDSIDAYVYGRDFILADEATSKLLYRIDDIFECVELEPKEFDEYINYLDDIINGSESFYKNGMNILGGSLFLFLPATFCPFGVYMAYASYNTNEFNNYVAGSMALLTTAVILSGLYLVSTLLDSNYKNYNLVKNRKKECETKDCNRVINNPTEYFFSDYNVQGKIIGIDEEGELILSANEER